MYIFTFEFESLVTIFANFDGIIKILKFNFLFNLWCFSLVTIIVLSPYTEENRPKIFAKTNLQRNFKISILNTLL